MRKVNTPQFFHFFSHLSSFLFSPYSFMFSHLALEIVEIICNPGRIKSIKNIKDKRDLFSNHFQQEM